MGGGIGPCRCRADTCHIVQNMGRWETLKLIIEITTLPELGKLRPHEEASPEILWGRAVMSMAGIRVLDLSQVISGPLATSFLADQGADVIKVERTTGDDSRAIGPFSADGESSYFMSVNRGKRSVAVNTRSEPGKRILKALASLTKNVG